MEASTIVNECERLHVRLAQSSILPPTSFGQAIPDPLPASASLPTSPLAPRKARSLPSELSRRDTFPQFSEEHVGRSTSTTSGRHSRNASAASIGSILQLPQAVQALGADTANDAELSLPALPVELPVADEPSPHLASPVKQILSPRPSHNDAANKRQAASLDTATQQYKSGAAEVRAVVQAKDREIASLREALAHEVHLKNLHYLHMGTLHRQRVQESTYEADRQAMVRLRCLCILFCNMLS